MADNNGNADTTATPGSQSGGRNGGYSDGLLKLVEETDKDGGISYCVECATTGDLLYSSNSKPQAYSFCEGYRARDTNADDTSKADKAKDDNPPDDKAKPTHFIDPAKVQRKRAVI
jgi:hypothetical protein